MNGGTKGIDNPLLQLEEEESAANGSAVLTNGKANGVVEDPASESGKATTVEENVEEKTEKEEKSADDPQ
jgi:hypothetical protein